MEKAEAARYLESLIGRMFRVHIKDTRMFLGEFKCTDNERNIILGKTYEYRVPSQPPDEALSQPQDESTGRTTRADMTSRFLGLVVIPGQQITKIEVEERPSYNLPIRPPPSTT